ncbi:gliding motility-associated C-terminal domain-containing protein [Pontibacter liquoris]|uniref:gliding motility-associated C-terminal domain-containing protein n=1 Tax=Pontibacter liquoris TaxID=2905677 RepID=UPI001FA78200|nr:gliding motility-associated C-terminal domain-containing protein [Pontibacter liquoris]
MLIIWIILAQAGGVLAQSGIPGCFEAFDTKGKKIETLCVGQEVTFQDCGNKVPDENEYYVFDYQSDSPIPTPATPDKKHTYNAPGRYRVLQIANYGGATLTDTVSLVFEVKEALAPTFAYTLCANRRVSVQVTNRNYDSYVLDFGDGQQQAAKSGDQYSHTYAAAGNFTLTLTGIYSGAPCQGIYTQAVSVQGSVPVPNLVKLEVLQQALTGQLQVSLQNLQPGLRYTIERQQNPGSPYQTIDTIQQVTQAALSYTLANVNTAESAGYRVRPTDACRSQLQEVSNAVQSIALTASPAEAKVTLTWSKAPASVQRAEIYRNGSIYTSTDYTATTYTDTDVRCGNTYTYQLAYTYPNGVESLSAPQQAAVVSTAVPPKGQLLATFDLDNQLQLTLEVPPGQALQQMQLEQSIAGGPYKALATAVQPSFTLSTPDLSQGACYRASYTNSCGNNAGYSNNACPMLLKAVAEPDGSINLSWTRYEGFAGGVGTYTVELLSSDKQLLATYPASGTTYTDKAPGSESLLLYRIKATAKNGTAVSYSNIQTLEQPLLLFVPSAFTPNSDGLNDVLEIKGRYFSNFRMRIYNRLGNMLYESADAQTGWDGTFKGQPAPAGVYTYEITVTTATGTPERRTGTITLLR